MNDVEVQREPQAEKVPAPAARNPRRRQRERPPPPRASWIDRSRKAIRRFARRQASFVFVLAFLFLNVVANLRYPGREPALWYLTASIDVLLVFVYLAWFKSLGWTVPRWLRLIVVGYFVLVRLIRLGDGIQDRFFAQKFNFYTDLPLLPELVRFLISSLSTPGFVLAAVAAVAGVGAVAALTYFALVHAEHYLSKRRHVYSAVAMTGFMFFVTWSVGHKPNYDELFLWDGLAVSFIPRLRHEARFLSNVYDERAGHASAITAAQARYQSMPTDLAKLGRANVHLIVVESYGQCVLEWPGHVAYMKDTFDGFEKELTARGFSIVTGFLNSSTYGGQSWFAHATLGTGIRVTNQLKYEITLAKKPKTIASFFRAAGYRTVLVAPGTSREWPKGEFYNFDQKYYGWDFGYRGPWFAWAPMPDQFVLDFVRRRELSKASSQPLFIQYLLVSSHAPWSDIPAVVDDWSKLGDGSIYKRIARHRYRVVWPHFENASEAYAHSIRYDFQILRRYLADYITDGSLVVILGDHQPVWDVNGHSDSWGVPVHVLSRNPALLEPFKALGYTPGLRKTPHGRYAGLESFLPDLVAGFSTSRVR